MATLATQGTWEAGNLHYRDGNLSPANTLWGTCPLLAIACEPHLARIYRNDFTEYTTGEAGLASTLTNSGTTAVAAATSALPSGALVITCSDGSVADNDEAYVGSEVKTWILQAGKDLWYETGVKFTEANTDDANIMVGLTSTYAANALVDNGAGPPADYDGIVLYKVDGGTTWIAETSASTNQTTVTGLPTRQSGSWTRLGFHVVSTDRVDFYVDGVQVGSISAYLPTAAMGLFLGAKNGDTNNEVLNADRVDIVQLR